jgi:ribose transport system substrate-binding protein
MVAQLEKMVDQGSCISLIMKKGRNQMRKTIIAVFILSTFLIGFLLGQSVKNKKQIIIGMIGKRASNPVFMASYTGARVAAKELGEKYKLDIKIDWKTPAEENVEEQAASIEKFTQAKIDGISVSCIDANYLTHVIDDAVDKGVPVMCFDSDAPKSKRFAYYGADDVEFGKMLMKELATELKGKGNIAVLAGNKNALNLQRRLQGIKEEVKKYPNITLHADNVYYNIEIPEIASEKIARAQKENPDINGWILIGSTALQVQNTFKWKAGEVKVVAGNAVPVELEYVKSGYVQRLVGINCFQMGYKSVELLLDKILKNRMPDEPCISTPLTPVSKDNVEEWSLNWKKWLIKEAVYR